MNEKLDSFFQTCDTQSSFKGRPNIQTEDQ